MDKKIAGLVGALSAVTVAGPAAPAVATPEAYANLVRPIPNARTALMLDEAGPRSKSEVGDIQEAQYYHHHHHRWWPRRYYHHHHHHHRYHHHHHHWYWSGRNRREVKGGPRLNGGPPVLPRAPLSPAANPLPPRECADRSRRRSCSSTTSIGCPWTASRGCRRCGATAIRVQPPPPRSSARARTRIPLGAS